MSSFIHLQNLNVNGYKPDEKRGEGRQREKKLVICNSSTLVWLKRNTYDHIHPSCTLPEEWSMYSVYY